MARIVRIRFHRRGYSDLMAGPEAQAMLERRAQAIAAACNNDSTWGGYFYAVSGKEGTGKARDAQGRFLRAKVRARARIWSADRRNDEARDQRLIRNLDAGGAG